MSRCERNINLEQTTPAFPVGIIAGSTRRACGLISDGDMGSQKIRSILLTRMLYEIEVKL